MKTFVLTIAGLLICLSLTAQKKDYQIAAIGFYNLENLFDTLDSPTTNDADFLPNVRVL